MKNIKIILALGFLAFLIGCQGMNPVSTLDSKSLSVQPKLLAGDQPVVLYFVSGTSMPEPMGPSEAGYITGNIELENIAYTKSVVIHYSVNGGAWQDAAATFKKSLANNRECWSFNVKVGTSSWYHGMYTGFDVKFAVKYTVNGVTYWDNNGGQDYKVSTPGTVSVPAYPYAVLGKSIVALYSTSTYWTFYNGGQSPTIWGVGGNILLKNLAYNKIVNVVYTTNNWATSGVISATYNSNMTAGNNSEFWSFKLEGLGTGTVFKYAISYTVNGSTAWDNNFGLNYQIITQ